MNQSLPSRIPAERSVLAAAMESAEYFAIVAEVLQPSDFFDPRNRIIFEALGDLGGMADQLVLLEHLRKTGKLDQVGGAYPGELITSVPDFSAVRKHAQYVKEAAAQRAAIVGAHRIEQAAWQGGPEWQDVVEEESLRMSSTAYRPKRSAQTADEFARLAQERLEKPSGPGEWLTGLASGLSDFDVLTGGIPPGVLSIIGARPATGKTGFMLNIGLHVAAQGGTVVMFEMDMSERMVTDRIIAILSGIPLDRIKKRRMSAEEFQRASQAVGKFASFRDRLRIRYDLRSIHQIAAEIRRLSTSGLDLAFTDHIGHIAGGTGESRYLRVGDVSRRLMDIAAIAGVPVVALAQLNREAEHRAPNLSDLRESGNLEQDARLIALLDAPRFRDRGEDDCRLDLLIRKNSEGSWGERTVHFNLETQRIETTANTGACSLCGRIGRRGVA